jgi:hypothetical protein
MKYALMVVCLTGLAGCASMVPPDMTPITTEQREFTFDFTVPGKSQTELYRSARDYLATAYRDSRAVTRVDDESQGTIIGKGVAPWSFTTSSTMIPSMPCSSYYDVIFIAKEGRARLQLTLKEGMPNPSVCGWSLPPKRDYPQIVGQFLTMSGQLESALNGRGVVDKVRNF